MHKHQIMVSIVIFMAGFTLGTVRDGRYLVSLAEGTLSKTASPEATVQAAQKPSTPQLWDYRVVSKPVDRKSNIDDQLSSLGAQGFEIYSVTQSSENLGSYVTIVLRRPKQQLFQARRVEITFSAALGVFREGYETPLLLTCCCFPALRSPRF